MSRRSFFKALRPDSFYRSTRDISKKKVAKDVLCYSAEYSRNYTIQMMRMLKDKLKI